MNVAECPHCREPVTFIREGNYYRCPKCGNMFQFSHRRAPEAGDPISASGFWPVFGLVVKTLLIMLAVVVVFIGLAFAGCMIALRQH
jgi:hypothetical protein